jgi:hypothetical protein
MPATIRSAIDSAYVLQLMDEMKKTWVDQVFTHQHVALILPPDKFNQNQRYTMVRKAITRLRQERGLIFVTVRGEGYRLLNSIVGVNHIGGVSIDRVHNAADRGSRDLGDALHHHGRSLSAADTRTNSNRQAVLGIVRHIAKQKTVDRMPEADEPYKPADALSGLAGIRKILGV